MASCVIGVGMSHSPMVVSDTPTWLRFGQADRQHPFLATTDGRPVTYAELEREQGALHTADAQPANLERQVGEVRAGVARLRDDLAAAAPDVILVIGDDQMELCDLNNMPALAVYYGAELITSEGRRRMLTSEAVGASASIARRAGQRTELDAAYGMDAMHVWPGHPELALHLIATLLHRGFDPCAMGGVDTERGGIGHAFGIVETQLMEAGSIPLVPIFLNGYWHPNQMPVSRAYDLGVALRAAIDSFPESLRVAVIASGGLSHFVTDETLDRAVLAALRDHDETALRTLPAQSLLFGSSEIRNWIALAAICEDHDLVWDEYIPVYRTPAGTGCGLAFARWSHR